jgi:hypothetical protein
MFIVCGSGTKWVSPAGGRSPDARSTRDPAASTAFVWKSPQGYEVENRGTFEDVSAPEQLVTMPDAGAGTTRHTVVLTEEGIKTTMPYTVECPSTEMPRLADASPEPELGLAWFGDAVEGEFVRGTRAWEGDVPHPTPFRQLTCTLEGHLRDPGERRNYSTVRCGHARRRAVARWVNDCGPSKPPGSATAGPTRG